MIDANMILAEFRKTGTTGYVFLEIPVSARIASMGETSVAISNIGAEAMFANPALLGYLNSKHDFNISYANYLANIKHQSFAYCLKVSELGILGINVNQIDLGEIVETINADPENPGAKYEILGKYNADATAVGITFSNRATTWFSYGLTMKYIQERISKYKSTNAVFDIGMVYYTNFHSLRIGGYIQNFGVDSKYIGDTFKMPTIFRLGAAAEIIGDIDSPTRFTLLLDALHPSDYTERINLGMEMWVKNVLAIRGGYKFNYNEEGLTLGLGMKWRTSSIPFQQISFDLSYTDYGRLEYVSRFSFNISL
jgi:hypothetical protein